MSWVGLFTELNELEKGILIYLKAFTIGPQHSKSWSQIRDYIYKNRETHLKYGLKDYEKPTVNVKVSRALKKLTDKKYVTREGGHKHTVFKMDNEDVRKAIAEFLEPFGSQLYVVGPYPIPNNEVSGFDEFREFVLNNGVFHAALFGAWREYTKNYPNLYNEVHDDPELWENIKKRAVKKYLATTS